MHAECTARSMLHAFTCTFGCQSLIIDHTNMDAMRARILTADSTLQAPICNRRTRRQGETG